MKGIQSKMHCLCLRNISLQVRVMHDRDEFLSQSLK